jgi:AcrR family transcriptional regulator
MSRAKLLSLYSYSVSYSTVDWGTPQTPAPGSKADGLRARKKALTRQRLSDTATQMFLEHGFDAVRVTEVAAACDVSEKTVYNYFPTKESLVLDRWESTAKALRAGLADASKHPVDVVRDILAGELAALTGWLGAQRDQAAAAGSVRLFGRLIVTTPALRAHQNDTMNELVMTTAALLAGRAGLSADDPEPQIAASALIGLWRVHFAAVRKYLDGARSPEDVCEAVTADVEAAAQLIRAGLDSRPWDTNRRR